MKSITFWFDPISPYAYLAFERLPVALEGLSYEVRYRPVLFAALLKHWGQKGPAEIEPKRAWTFRQVHWWAHQHAIAIDTPARHPFNPLAHLRLLVACGGASGEPNRYVCETVLRDLWRGGADPSDPARVAALTARLAPPLDPNADAVKAALRANGDAALAAGVFGVPTMEVDGRLFWGADSLAMLAAFLRGDAWFDGPAWEREGQPRPGIARG